MHLRVGLWAAIAISIGACSGSQSGSQSGSETEPVATQGETASGQETAGDPATAAGAITWVLWHDIQGLMGGRALYIQADGTALARIVEPPPDEHRHRGTLTQAQMEELADQLRTSDFLRMTVPDRDGIPDEARARLIVHFASGQERRVEKWEGVDHEGFDQLNGLMRSFTEDLRRQGSDEVVPFDGAFMPPGPWPDPWGS